MTASEELFLYMNDRKAWAAYAAPRWIEIMKREPERKQEMWRTAGAELRTEIRRLAEEKRHA